MMIHLGKLAAQNQPRNYITTRKTGVSATRSVSPNTYIEPQKEFKLISEMPHDKNQV